MYTVTATRGTELLQSERVATEHGALNIAVVYLQALAADQENRPAPAVLGCVVTGRICTDW